MAWTAPRTWVTAELVTASLMNVHVRDDLLWLSQSRSWQPSIGDLNGGVINTGRKGWNEYHFPVRITGWTIVGDVSGSIVVDVWKKAYASLPATVSDSIAAGAKPALSSQLKAQTLGLAWDIDAGDWLYLNVDSATTVKQVTIAFRHELRA